MEKPASSSLVSRFFHIYSHRMDIRCFLQRFMHRGIIDAVSPLYLKGNFDIPD